jgi:hypothetical protein
MNCSDEARRPRSLSFDLELTRLCSFLDIDVAGSRRRHQLLSPQVHKGQRQTEHRPKEEWRGEAGYRVTSRVPHFYATSAVISARAECSKHRRRRDCHTSFDRGKKSRHHAALRSTPEGYCDRGLVLCATAASLDYCDAEASRSRCAAEIGTARWTVDSTCRAREKPASLGGHRLISRMGEWCCRRSVRHPSHQRGPRDMPDPSEKAHANPDILGDALPGRGDAGWTDISSSVPLPSNRQAGGEKPALPSGD